MNVWEICNLLVHAFLKIFFSKTIWSKKILSQLFYIEIHVYGEQSSQNQGQIGFEGQILH